jgi:hypothetical protein
VEKEKEQKKIKRESLKKVKEEEESKNKPHCPVVFQAPTIITPHARKSRKPNTYGVNQMI